MRILNTSLLRVSLSIVISIAFSLALAETAGATTMDFETMGPGWFAGGINSTWVRVAPSAFGTDHGLWNLSDLDQALAIAAANPSDPRLLGTYSGIVNQINFSDDVYDNVYTGAPWGVNGDLPPFFAPGDGPQDDWGARFTGLINIEKEGWYNFGVLSDDGFAFELRDGGNTYQMSQDGLNPRDRYGLPNDLHLGIGQYAFTLDAYEHLEAGVVSLGVWHEPAASIPEPASVASLLAGIGCVALLYRKNRTSANAGAQ